MNEQINALISSLQELAKANLDLDKVKQEQAKLATEVDALTAELKEKQAALSSATAGLTAAQVTAQHEYDVQIQAKHAELVQLSESIRAAQEKLALVTADNNTALVKHNEIVASMAAIRKRLAS